MQIFSRQLTILDEADSTNNYAMQQIDDGKANHGEAWAARYQRAGKGQRGKKWQSEKDKNILLSVALQPDAPVSEQFYLSAAMALAARAFFSRHVYTDEKVKLKWPNDIFWGDIKAGGMLIENKIIGQKWTWAVVGLGINVNQEEFQSNMPYKAVSLKMIRGVDFDVPKLTAELYEDVEKYFQLFQEEEYQKILNEYNHYLYKKGQNVRFKKENISFEGEVIGVNNMGKLMIKTSMLEEFDFGELEWEM